MLTFLIHTISQQLHTLLDNASSALILHVDQNNIAQFPQAKLKAIANLTKLAAPIQSCPTPKALEPIITDFAMYLHDHDPEFLPIFHAATTHLLRQLNSPRYDNPSQYQLSLF